MRKGFSLIEMLTVMGIIAVLIGASLGGYSVFVKRAQRVRAVEQVANVRTALEAILQNKSTWPRTILSAGQGGGGECTEEVTASIAQQKVMNIVFRTKEQDGEKKYEPLGVDRLGLVSPWAQDVLKRNASAAESTPVPSGGTIKDHRLWIAVDDDYDGRVSGNVGGKTVNVRGSVMVWSAGADGVMSEYSESGKNDDVYSWSKGQVIK